MVLLFCKSCIPIKHSFRPRSQGLVRRDAFLPDTRMQFWNIGLNPNVFRRRRRYCGELGYLRT